MANTIANRRYVEQLEADAKKLKQEKTAAEAIATLADERMKAAYSAKDEVLAEKSQRAGAARRLPGREGRARRAIAPHRTPAAGRELGLAVGVHQARKRAKELQAQLEKVSSEKGSLDAQLAVAASERRGTDEATRRTEQLLARFQEDHPALLAKLEASEDHNRELRLTRDAQIDEIAQLKRDLAQAIAEKSGLADLHKREEEEHGRMEQNKSQLQERCENAEARCRELQHSKDAAFAERSRALQQLAVLTSEKNAADEQGMRLQTQLREDRGSLTVRCETAEAAAREVTRDRDALAEEKARMGEQLAVMSVEKREAEARCSQLEKTLQMTQEERGALQVKSEGVENRLRDIEAMKEVSSEQQQQHSASQQQHCTRQEHATHHSLPSLPSLRSRRRLRSGRSSSRRWPSNSPRSVESRRRRRDRSSP